MRHFLLIVVVLLYSVMGFSQTGSYDPNTGDTEFDTFLTELNTGAQEDQTQFKTEVSVEFNVPITTVNTIFQIDGIQPADVFLLFSIAQEKKKPVETLIPTFKKNRGKGWGLVLKAMKANKNTDRQMLKNRVVKKNQMIKEKKKLLHEQKMKNTKDLKKQPAGKKKDK